MLNKEQIKNIKDKLDLEDAFFPLILQALGDLGRFKIFKLLAHSHDFCVTDIANILGTSVSAASQQLRVLERLNLIKKIRMGQKICYEINYSNVAVKRLLILFN